MELKFYNTLTRSLETFKSVEEGKAGLYTCGPTVYNFAHIGNFRAYIFEDLLHRTLEYAGYKVKQVMNLTDVDDKTIRNSRAAGVPLRDFTATYKKAFFEDIKTLNITPAAIYPAATDHIAEMIAMIQVLMDKGIAYQSEDKSIYFSIEKFPEYGKLAHIDRDNQRAGVRIDADEYAKDSVADFALWKARDEADGDVWWPSPWGEGRPGWHIECSAMSMKYLGESFDLHTGGVDNMFPHHEDEIAQSESVTGKKWVNYWLHCEHLMVDNTKMSKSLGNFYTLRDLLEKGYTGREVRWVLIGTHYRKKLNFSLAALDQARETLGKFSTLFARMKEITAAGDGSEVATAVEQAQNQFRTAIADDLNSAGATAALFALVREGNRLADSGTLSAAGAAKILDCCRDFDRIFGCLDVDAVPVAEEFPAEVVAMAEERAAARKNKDWAESDRLRDAIKAAGFLVEDAPGGVWKLKKL
ncbi:MAG: cysteine--tRNA ligase [Lentisphaeria bacterium]|nr:cysteine--tRNA ligase [Lentisphaeria bacterium]